MNKINKELIQDYIKNKKLTNSKFCELCHISISTLKKVYNNNFNLNVIVLFKIARTLNVPISSLFC